MRVARRGDRYIVFWVHALIIFSLAEGGLARSFVYPTVCEKAGGLGYV